MNNLNNFAELLEKYEKGKISLDELKNKLIKKKECEKEYKLFSQIRTHNGPVERILCTHHFRDTFLISIGQDGLIKIIDIDTQLLVQTLYGHRAHVVDICLHSDGNYMISADIAGIVIIHKFEEESGKFQFLKKIEIGSEVLFCEFVKGMEYKNVKEAVPLESSTEFVALTVMGTLIYFDIEKGELYRNEVLSGNVLKSCCVTDGGRFIFCGGDWCYLFIYDVYEENKIVLFEDYVKTDESISIKYITGAKNGFKVATSYENTIALYYQKKKELIKGFINISEYTVGTGKLMVFSMEFLYSGILLVLGTDKALRLYLHDILVTIKNDVDLGAVYAHSTLNIFCIADDKTLRFYEVLEKVIEVKEFCRIEISTQVNNGVFSNNGKYFITSDHIGTIKTYALNFEGKDKKSVQYFKYDLCLNTKNGDKMISCIENIDFDQNVYELLKESELSLKKINDQFDQNKIQFLYDNILYKETYDPQNKNDFWKSTKMTQKERKPNSYWVAENVVVNFLKKYLVDAEEVARMKYMAKFSDQVSNEQIEENLSIESDMGDRTIEIATTEEKKKRRREYSEEKQTKPKARRMIIESSEDFIEGNIKESKEDFIKDAKEENGVIINNVINQINQTNQKKIEEDMKIAARIDKKLNSSKRMLRKDIGRELYEASSTKSEEEKEIVLRNRKIKRPQQYLDEYKSVEVASDESNVNYKRVKKAKNDSTEISPMSEESSIESLSKESSIESENISEDREESLSETLDDFSTLRGEESNFTNEPNIHNETSFVTKDNIVTLLKNTPFKPNRKILESLEEQVKNITKIEKDDAELLTNKDPYRDWFINLPYSKNDEIYLNAQEYLRFAKEEKRILNNQDIKSGIYKINDISCKKMYYEEDQGKYLVYLRMILERNGKMYKNINFYESSGNPAGIMCLNIQKQFDIYDTVVIQKSNLLIKGKIMNIRNLTVKLDSSEEYFLMSEIYVGRSNLNLDEFYIADAEKYRAPNLYMNYERINHRIEKRFYKNIKELKKDIIHVCMEFKKLGIEFYSHAQEMLNRLSQ